MNGNSDQEKTLSNSQYQSPTARNATRAAPCLPIPPKGFTSQYADAVTGLDYYNARYYDPVAGVFLSADSVQGNMQGMNPYGYVGGNPETRNDPTGLCPFCIAALVVGIVVGAAVVGNIVGTAIQGYATGKPPSASDYADAAAIGALEGLGVVAIGALILTAPVTVVGFTVGAAIGAFASGFIAGLATGIWEGIRARFSSGGSQQCSSNDNCTRCPVAQLIIVVHQSQRQHPRQQRDRQQYTSLDHTQRVALQHSQVYQKECLRQNIWGQ